MLICNLLHNIKLQYIESSYVPEVTWLIASTIYFLLGHILSKIKAVAMATPRERSI